MRRKGKGSGGTALRRETEDEIVGEFADLAITSMRAEVFDTLVELNGRCLDLLADQALSQPTQGNLLLRQVAEVWRTLDAAGRWRAAGCPFLLVDAGFSDPGRWRSEGRHVSDGAAPSYSTFFTVPRASSVATQVFIYAWHLAQSKSKAAQLLLGMPAHCSQLISACTLPQIHELAESHPEWLRPRWPTKVKVWREMLLAAASGEVVALENSRMHGLQLLAGEVRAASLRLT